MKYAENNLKDVCFTLPTQRIDYRIIISDVGELLDIVEFNKNVPYPLAPTGRTGKCIKSCVLDYNSKYIFGIYFDKTSKNLKLDDNGCNNVFKKVQSDFFDSLNSPKCIAFNNFIKHWEPEKQINNPILNKIKKSFDKHFAFSLNTLDNYIETDKLFLDRYIDKEMDNNERINVCSVTGNVGEYARLHNNIKLSGCFKGAQPIITFNDSTTSISFESNFKNSDNSYITTNTMNIYTYTLNKLLNSETNHINIWNNNTTTTFIYFTTSPKCNDLCNSIMSILLNSNDKTITDNTLHSMMDKVKHIESIDLSDIDVSSTDFYLFELNPNAQASNARISIKNQYHNNFGNIINNINSFQNRFKINSDTKPITPTNIIEASLPYGTQKHKEYKNTTEYIKYYTDFIDIALNNKQIPSNIFQKVINEYVRDFMLYRKDGKFNTPDYLKSIRHRIIKAYINYKYNKEVINMSLETNSDNFKLPFLLGGLLELYDCKQRLAMPNINSPLSKVHFKRAIESPNYIIAELYKKTIIYDNKISWGLRKWINDLISEQIAKINDCLTSGGVIPNKFNLEEQSCFILGYEKMKTSKPTKEKNETESKHTNNNE